MPVVFDEVDTEIAPEQRTTPQTTRDSGETAVRPAEFADHLRSALHTMEARHLRLRAD